MLAIALSVFTLASREYPFFVPPFCRLTKEPLVMQHHRSIGRRRERQVSLGLNTGCQPEQFISVPFVWRGSDEMGWIVVGKHNPA